MEKHQKIVVTGFLLRDNKVLIVKRSAQEAFLPNVYELPGGKLEFAEDPIEGVVRELKEETGLDVIAGLPYRTYSYVSQDGTRHTVEIAFIISLQNSSAREVRLSNAHVDFQWIADDEIDSFDMTPEAKITIRQGFGI